MVILENIDIYIDIDKAILQNIDIDKISNRFKFGISNRASAALLSWLSGRLSFRYPRMVIPKWRSVLLASGDRAYCLLVSQDTHMHAPNLEICKCFHGDAAI